MGNIKNIAKKFSPRTKLYKQTVQAREKRWETNTSKQWMENISLFDLLIIHLSSTLVQSEWHWIIKRQSKEKGSTHLLAQLCLSQDEPGSIKAWSWTHQVCLISSLVDQMQCLHCSQERTILMWAPLYCFFSKKMFYHFSFLDFFFLVLVISRGFSKTRRCLRFNSLWKEKKGRKRREFNKTKGVGWEWRFGIGVWWWIREICVFLLFFFFFFFFFCA